MFIKVVKELLYIVNDAESLGEPGTEKWEVDKFVKGMFLRWLTLDLGKTLRPLIKEVKSVRFVHSDETTPVSRRGSSSSRDSAAVPAVMNGTDMPPADIDKLVQILEARLKAVK
jgi:hypothetical protein